ncbi:PEGA domain-containing protein [Spirosoma validum]|uniref:SHOCT domain-containing protein n=1 Tax=Spirosoma validum TaxID=2771355 RepID=A0A927AZS6_9BACT|nr:PEGA domain-containing protein [Spirosoma validum]MBD2752869.1 SHOCT domain-containing protein [Spirosoma validum]
MKSSSFRLIPLALAGLIVLESCSSYTVIQSKPSGAKLYLNDSPVGVTPYRHVDTKIVGSTTWVRLEKEGYAPLQTSFSRNEQADVGAIVGGVFLLFPFLWTMKYSPTHDYELMPIADGQAPTPSIAPMPLANDAAVSTSKATRLRELKKLLDDGILTKDEYEKEKKKVLDTDN